MADGTLKVGTITTSSGSGTITIPSGVSLSGGVGNTPAFQAYQGSAQTYGNSATVIQANTEVFDSNSCYDTSTYKFTPTVAGKYYFYAQIYITSPGTNLTMQCILQKNGSDFAKGDSHSAINRDQAVVAHGVVDLNGSTDYVELKGYNSSSKTTVAGTQYTYFGGFKLIGA